MPGRLLIVRLSLKGSIPGIIEKRRLGFYYWLTGIEQMKIEVDGIYRLDSFGAGSSQKQSVYLSGTGTVQLGYVDDYGTWIPLEDGDLQPGKQYQVFSGPESPVMVKVSGGAKISLITVGIN